ncbi:MAG: type III toxin-antitoxin system ToxN/AbiQ family toxin [Oscillospiraceae bacterium]
MKRERLKIYHIDMKYIRDLSNKDGNVMTVSPQINKETRPFVGIVVICDKQKYCIPLSSPKPKYHKMKNDKDFSKIYDKKQKLIGVLNFNSMIPVDNSVIRTVDIKINPSDSQSDKYYKGLLNDQLDWCNDNQEAIEIKANKLYELVTETPDKMRSLTRRCCNFKKLEAVLAKRKDNNLDEQDCSKPLSISRKQIKENADKISREKSLNKNKEKQELKL